MVSIAGSKGGIHIKDKVPKKGIAEFVKTLKEGKINISSIIESKGEFHIENIAQDMGRFIE